MRVAIVSLFSKVRAIRWSVGLAVGVLILSVLVFVFSSKHWQNYSYNAVACLLAAVLIGLRRLIPPRIPIERFLYLLPLLLLFVIVLSHNYQRDVERMFSKSSIRTWNVYHYYLGSKYFDELGYLDLYKQTLVADREGKNRLAEIKRIRDLETYKTIPVKRLKDLKRSEKFTDKRWKRFKKDLKVLMRKKSDATWFGMLNDRGYNPTPFWNTLGRWISHALKISKKRNLLLLTSLDLIAYGLMFVALVWAFGIEAGILTFLAFSLLPFSQGRLIGGYLQYDWFAAITFGMCFWRKGKSVLAGVFFGYATMARVFPLLFVAGLAFPALHHLIKHHRLERRHILLLASFGLFCLVGLGLGSLSSEGPSAWLHWKSKIELHNHEMTYGEQRMGLKHLFTHELGSDDYRAGNARRKNLDEQKDLYLVSAGLLLLLLLPTWWTTRRETNAMLLMHGVFFALLISSRYYWSVMALFPLWQVLSNAGESPPDADRSSKESQPWYAPIAWPALLPFLISAAWFYDALEQTNKYIRYLHLNTLILIALVTLMGLLLGQEVLFRLRSGKDIPKEAEGEGQSATS